MDLSMDVWNIKGLSTSDKQKEVRNLIKEENLHLCGLIETHVKYNKVQRIGEKVFGSWEFISNSEDNNQVYASNSYIERRKLWKDLGAHNIITSGDPWSILGDFNVSLKVEEHSNGCSALSNKMNEFLEITKEIEVEDILSSGFHLKKLDTLKIPNGLEKRRKAFRFSNFVTGKKEFSSTVKKGWEIEIEGHMMHRVSELSSDNLKASQADVDRNPFDEDIKAKSCKILNEYYEAMNDEDSLLRQKAKIEWLKDRDMNTKFFHKIIKGRQHKGRIMSVCNEKGDRFENEKVAEHFVLHFKEFLGKKYKVTDFPTNTIVFPNMLSREEASRMCRDVSEVEVKNAMFDIDDSKAPGPDGYTARFYKSAWSIIRKDVCKAV
ncbi:RNA-directed DNA polymerase, eukaryota, reverse transcriptase zinc-binding domain protein [Tanacetum coccineum]